MPQVQQQLELAWDNFKNINWGCHGIPERCLVFKGKRMRVCARCFGCNIGHTLSFLVFIFGMLPPWYWGFIAVGIMLIDWSLQEFFKIVSNKYRRVITGIIGGFGAGILLWSGASLLFTPIKYLF
jgi:uncharacterized membrane protein